VLRVDELGIYTKSGRHLWVSLRKGDLSLEACGVSPSLAIVTQSAVAWSLELLKDIGHRMSNSGSLHEMRVHQLILWKSLIVLSTELT